MCPEREFQIERGGQWVKGKSCETFNPLGPWFGPADEVKTAKLGPALRINGVQRRTANTDNMISRWTTSSGISASSWCSSRATW